MEKTEEEENKAQISGNAIDVHLTFLCYGYRAFWTFSKIFSICFSLSLNFCGFFSACHFPDWVWRVIYGVWMTSLNERNHRKLWSEFKHKHKPKWRDLFSIFESDYLLLLCGLVAVDKSIATEKYFLKWYAPNEMYQSVCPYSLHNG